MLSSLRQRVAAAPDQAGQLLGTASFPASTRGIAYNDLEPGTMSVLIGFRRGNQGPGA